MKYLFVLIPIFLLCFKTRAQEPLRVGVVLSGGGAKGVAHIGALRVLEEAGIRIDYIGGASMGGIVGGLYAAGWTVDQLDSLLRANDLAQVLRDEVRRDYQPFFSKRYGEKYALRLSFKDFKLALPPALSDGQQAFDFLSELTDRVAGIDEFSQLPTPFFCIGTDVENGEQVLLERGNLARAIRAGGSFPGLLAPVEVDGRLLTDGGVVNDFPAKEMREKGMDIVIGINVEAGLYDKQQLRSMEKIIEQIGSYQMMARSKEQIPFCDLVIRPDIDGYGVTSFDAVDTLVLRGERAARTQWDALVQIARAQQAAPPPRRQTPDLPTEDDDCPLYIHEVTVAGYPARSKRALLRKFPRPLPGEIGFDEFREGISALYATDQFQCIDYDFDLEPGGSRRLDMRLYLRPGYLSSLRLGLHYDPVYKSSLLLNGTFRNAGISNSVLSIDAIAGDKLRYNLHYYVGGARGPGIGLNSRLNTVDLRVDLPVRVDIGGNVSVQNLLFDLTDLTQELYLNLASGNSFAAGLAAEFKFFKTATSQAVNYVTSNNYIDEKGWYAAGKAFFYHDSRDRLFFPRKGLLAGAEVRGIHPLQSLKYEAGSAKLGWNIDLHGALAYPLRSRLTALAALEIGYNLGVPAPPFRYFLGSVNRNLINNFRAFPGLAFAAVSGDNLVSGSLAGRYQVFKTHYLSVGGHIASVSAARAPFADGRGLLRSASISYGIDTFLGPVELTYAVSNRGDQWYFNLGYWF